ncbi:MAG: hypothetical protein ACI8S6_005094 [Myxococcota bacterium]
MTLANVLRVSALTMLLCGPAQAQPASDLAMAHLTEHTGLSATQLAPVRQRSWHGRQIVHLQQLYEGVPIQGAVSTLSVHDGEARLLRVHRVESITVSVAPGLDPAAAGRLAEAMISDTVAGEVTLRILPTDGGGVLIYAVTLLAGGMQEARVDVDAHTGQIHGVHTLVSNALGTIYPADLFDEPEDVELTGLPGDATVLDSEAAVVRSLVFDEDGASWEEHVAVTEPGGDFRFAPEDGVAEDAFAEVNTYHHITALVTYFEDVHDWSFVGPVTAVTGGTSTAPARTAQRPSPPCASPPQSSTWSREQPTTSRSSVETVRPTGSRSPRTSPSVRGHRTPVQWRMPRSRVAAGVRPLGR